MSTGDLLRFEEELGDFFGSVEGRGSARPVGSVEAKETREGEKTGETEGMGADEGFDEFQSAGSVEGTRKGCFDWAEVYTGETKGGRGKERAGSQEKAEDSERHLGRSGQVKQQREQSKDVFSNLWTLALKDNKKPPSCGDGE